MGIKHSFSWFPKFARATANAAATPTAFVIALFIIIVWGISGPAFGYSDTWQLIINTGTTIVTFLMVFLIQNTQNHDTVALQMKLDELIRANKGARNMLLDLENMDDDEIAHLREVYERLANQARGRAESRKEEKSKSPLHGRPAQP